MVSRIFRQKSLKQLSAPEHLDAAITVTEPRGWLAILMIAIILALILVWSLIGSIYTSVTAQGSWLP